MKGTFESTKFGKSRKRNISSPWPIYLFMLAIAAVFAALWVGVFTHLEGGWGIAFGVIALLDRVFRFFKLHLKSGGKLWLDM